MPPNHSPPRSFELRHLTPIIPNLRGWPDNYKVSTGIRNGGHKKRKKKFAKHIQDETLLDLSPRLSGLGYDDVGHNGTGI